MGFTDKVNKQPYTPKEKGHAIVRALPGGGLQMVPANEKVVSDFTRQPERAGLYFDAAFNPDKQKDKTTQRFMALYEATSCFYCGDSKLIGRWISTPNGNYRFHFACSCDPTKASVNSILELQRRGLNDLWCSLGGKCGQNCPLITKQSKCQRFNCPKFDPSYNEASDFINNFAGEITV